MTARLTDADVIATIRRHHLQANIAEYECTAPADACIDWEHAVVDPGGTIFGAGPYLKVPVQTGDDGEVWVRVYAPARLRRRLAARWKRGV